MDQAANTPGFAPLALMPDARSAATEASGSRASCRAARMLQAIRYGAEVEATSGEDKRSDNHGMEL